LRVGENARATENTGWRRQTDKRIGTAGKDPLGTDRFGHGRKSNIPGRDSKEAPRRLKNVDYGTDHFQVSAIALRTPSLHITQQKLAADGLPTDAISAETWPFFVSGSFWQSTWH